MMPVFIGTSGWQYAHWRERFYPRGTGQARWLEHYADRFATVESNAAFYRLPERKTFEAWARRTPDDFVMAVKMSRYLTHIRRLREPAEAVERFVERARGLGPKLGPVLIQLPPTFPFDGARLRETLDRFPPGTRVAVEVRHRSWDTAEFRDLLVERNAALCLADRRGFLPPTWRTADWGFIRFHEGRAAPRPCYGPDALRAWAERLADLWPSRADVYVYFNNDPLGCALRDAIVFADLVRDAGLEPTRVGDAGEITVG